VLLPRQQAKLARGTKDKEHTMSQTPNTAIAVIGILLAVPVVDHGRVIGIVTVDDVIDAIVQKSTEEVQKFGGMKALGLSVPPLIVLSADEVIE
jgi:Mg/Co/Ni transporter MgtE